MTTVSAREFNQDVSAAKRAAAEGPVIITDRGEPAFVLLAIEEYRRLSGSLSDLVSWLAMDDDVIDFQPQSADLTLRIPTL
jgi:prevent-host-death family protein